MSHTPVTIHAMAAISVRLDPETHNAVKRIARQQRRSAAALARIWIEDSVAAAQADTHGDIRISHTASGSVPRY